MPEDVFPTPLEGGPQYLKFLKQAKDWSAVTLEVTYEDQGKDFNESAADCAQLYELEYDGLSDDDTSVLDTFWNNHRRAIPFTLVEPRDDPWTQNEGSTVTGCHFVSYEADHRKVKFTQSRRVVIAKYP